ncbi:hypothetical protein GLOIN_2v1582480 [Rhizophagus clarus]|uniref:Uncharacterized protein n=1 Tax=Rhizophagus clarus TaxID=94130 RepID=A0A8H3QFN8_9GLOM|nr:hypothetical protein GLOIN_2v1582480 [Rhizophagus clarus]
MNILSSIKEEINVRKGNFSSIMKNKKKGLSKVFFIYLDVYQKNDILEELNCKESLQTISFVIHISLKDLTSLYYPGKIPFLLSLPNLSIDNYNGKSQKLSNNDQNFLKVEPGKNYRRCIWCINFSFHPKEKERIIFNLKSKRPIPSSLGPEWKCDSISRNVNIWQLHRDECLNYLMSAYNRSQD